MKIIQITLMLAVLPLLFSSCIVDLNSISGNGNIVTQTRSVRNFSAIELQSAANVEIIRGSDYAVSVSDYENIVRYLKTEVSGNRLIIQKEPFSPNLWNSKAKIIITMPDSLYSVMLAGSGNISIDQTFKGLELLKLYGSGLISINDNCQLNNLDAQITGSGNIRAKGTVNSLTTIITGSGNIQFSELKASIAKCTISGSGNIYLYVDNTLNAYLTGSGNIVYYGNPTVNSYSSGSGNVYKR